MTVNLPGFIDYNESGNYFYDRNGSWVAQIEAEHKEWDGEITHLEDVEDIDAFLENKLPSIILKLPLTFVIESTHTNFNNTEGMYKDFQVVDEQNGNHVQRVFVYQKARTAYQIVIATKNDNLLDGALYEIIESATIF